MVPDIYERLVRWYLRFNGYLAVENFFVNAADGGPTQVGEADILAVRHPHSREAPGFDLRNDQKLLAGAHDQFVDFVVAEVKGGRRGSVNEVWKPGGDLEVKQERVAYLIRWLGPISSETTIRTVARELQVDHLAQHGPFRFRVVHFSNHPTREVRSLPMQTITFRDIAAFIVRDRAGCWEEQSMGARSPHDQWDVDLNAIWKLAEPKPQNPNEEERIGAILGYLKDQAPK